MGFAFYFVFGMIVVPRKEQGKETFFKYMWDSLTWPKYLLGAKR